MVYSLLGEETLDLLCDKARSAPLGLFVEVGVYKGGSASRLAEICEEQNRELHLFDSFCGTPHACELDKHVVGDFKETSIAEVRAACPKAYIYPGIFPDTLPGLLTGIAFAHIDCDQYWSVLDSIDGLFPRLVKGGIMWFDDYGYLEGARTAILERFPMDKLNVVKTSQVYVVKG